VPAFVVLLMISAAAVPAAASEPCASCHSEVSIAGSIHEPAGCEGCHPGALEGPHDPPLVAVDCASCHSGAGGKFAASVHRQARTLDGGITCATCHGNHAIAAVEAESSPVSRSRIPQTCGRCHGDLKFVAEQPGLFSTRPFFAYQESVHGRAVGSGNLRAAVCSDCHAAHDVAQPNDPLSPIFRSSIPATCGTCHAAVLAEYRESIHGRAAAGGITDSPVCTDCHGIHSIRAPEDPQSTVSARAVSRSTCGRCHASERLSAEFGVPRQRVESYYDSFHGLESSLGSVSTANCASCHGVHNILPSADPRSTIHPANLPDTCGRCHPGASENFARGQIHLVMATPGGPGGPLEGADYPLGTRVVRWVRSFYRWLIALVIGGMVLHNLLDYVARARRAIAGIGATVERLTRVERLQHGLLMLSFLTLVITGFALKFPDSGWARLLFSGWPGLRPVAHRVAALLLMALGGWHLLWLFASARGREQWRALRPRLDDAREFVAAVRRNLGRAGAAPMPGRFGYVEKAEYWALIWGTLLMTATGVILWAQDTALRWMPKWGFDVAEVVHYYEAWLATLAIVVWHLYFTVLRPGNRSRRWAWITGRLGLEEWREEHPAEYVDRGAGPGPPRPAKEGEGA